MWAVKRGRGGKELGKGTDKVKQKRSQSCLEFRAFLEMQIAMSLQRGGRPVNVQLNGCDIPKD